jgi:subtilisin family serine protease
MRAAIGAAVKASSSVGVAVIDTGVSQHRSLNDVRQVYGKYNARDDNYGLGTHAAAVIAATNDALDVVGVAPGTVIYSLKALNYDGKGELVNVLDAMNWVAANAAWQTPPIRVVSISIGGTGLDNPLNTSSCASPVDVVQQVVCILAARGVVVVAAAGDETHNVDTKWPARYPQVLAVTAMADTDGLPGGRGKACNTADDAAATRFSNYVKAGDGVQEWHVVAAPGECVLSLAPGNATRTLSGTRMAAANVAGAVALCFGNVRAGDGPCASLTPGEVLAKFVADAAANAAAGRGFKYDRASGGRDGRHYGDMVDVAAF